MLDLKALAGSEHYALLLKEVYAKISGQHVLLIVYESGGSCHGSDVVNFRCGVYPVVEDLSVGVKDLSVSFDDLILVLKSQSCKLVVDRCTADGVVISSLTAEVLCLEVLTS